MTPTRPRLRHVSRWSEKESSSTGPEALIGVSTGYMDDARMDWRELIERAHAVSAGAIEISALSGPELPSLMRWAAHVEPPSFRYVAVHGPTKRIGLEPSELARHLDELPMWVASIVLHPDTLGKPEAFRCLGKRLVLENMDFRKESGRYTFELAELFDVLPEAGFCLDVAHARSLDADMGLAHALLDEFGDRLRQIHMSALDGHGHHVPVSQDDLRVYAPILERYPDVPVILEAPPPPWLLQTVR